MNIINLLCANINFEFSCSEWRTGFDLMTCDSYFTILIEVFPNHILVENTYFTNHIEWTEYIIMVLKPVNKYQIIWQCDSFRTILTDDFFMSKYFVNITFYGTENDKLLSRDNPPLNIYLLFNLLKCQKNVS